MQNAAPSWGLHRCGSPPPATAQATRDTSAAQNPWCMPQGHPACCGTLSPLAPGPLIRVQGAVCRDGVRASRHAFFGTCAPASCGSHALCQAPTPVRTRGRALPAAPPSPALPQERPQAALGGQQQGRDCNGLLQGYTKGIASRRGGQKAHAWVRWRPRHRGAGNPGEDKRQAAAGTRGVVPPPHTHLLVEVRDVDGPLDADLSVELPTAGPTHPPLAGGELALSSPSPGWAPHAHMRPSLSRYKCAPHTHGRSRRHLKQQPAHTQTQGEGGAGQHGDASHPLWRHCFSANGGAIAGAMWQRHSHGGTHDVVSEAGAGAVAGVGSGPR